MTCFPSFFPRVCGIGKKGDGIKEDAVSRAFCKPFIELLYALAAHVLLCERY